MSEGAGLHDYIGSFGVSHALGQCYVVVRAQSREDAQEKMFQCYGARWAFLYDSREAAGVTQWNLREVPFGTSNA